VWFGRARDCGGHAAHVRATTLLHTPQSGVNLASSGTTATVAFQRGNRLWVAAAGDSRAILCTRNARDQWRALPLTIDHRPRRPSERERCVRNSPWCGAPRPCSST
jgi:serine/threonine protein phosphatase PrpC